MLSYLAGANTALFMIAALFFLRFWRRSRDGLFRWFAAAFFILGLEQLAGVVSGLPQDSRDWLYAVRLMAFIGLVVGIVAKNRPAGR